MLKLRINDKDIEVEEGLTVLQACEQAGAEIPRFCYHERLSIAGNCRMCLVEIEKSTKPVASCAMPAADGMKIGTKSIGDRAAPGGIVGASNYFTILSDRPTIIGDEFTIKNTGNTPELWNALENNTPQWRVTGEAYWNLSSMTAGGENEITFEFTR